MTCIESLRRRLAGLAPDPSPAGGLFTVTLDLDAGPAAFPANLPAPFFLWARPDRGHLRLGLGLAWSAEAAGPGRFERLHGAFEAITQRWRRLPLADGARRPGAFCAFAFEDEATMSGPWAGLPANLVAVPAVLLEVREGRRTLSLSCPTEALGAFEAQVETWLAQVAPLLSPPAAGEYGDAGPDAPTRMPGGMSEAAWRSLVQEVVGRIAAGHLTKVVLARQVAVAGNRPYCYAATLERLAKSYPQCLLIGVRLGERTLVAATPERLVTLREGTARCDALGGTGGRGRDAAEDRLLAQRLLQDAKTRHEHALVVDHIDAALRGMEAVVSRPAAPVVMPLGRLYHLWSEVEAQCPSDASLLGLAARLHPTPAVAGLPAAAAKAWLAQHESFDRGWYTGGIGWLEADGDGELAILLRCALLAGNRADLYAGAGIVDASDPQAEFAETELKLGGIIDALSGPD